jgi:trans-aconitate methyltransferase
MVQRCFAIRIVDLECGIGSTLRALAPRFPRGQNWRLFDNDFDLAARAGAMAPAATVTVTATPLDLGRDLEAALDGSIDLITISALLDLVSESWLEWLVVEISARSIPLYAAISHDGRIEIVSSDPFDTRLSQRPICISALIRGAGPR